MNEVEKDVKEVKEEVTWRSRQSWLEAHMAEANHEQTAVHVR